MAERLRFVNTASTPGGDGTTNATTGPNRAYASSNEGEAAEQTDLVAAGDTIRFVCEGTADDTLLLDIDGWTTGSANFIEFETDPAAAAGRHEGSYDAANFYALVVDTFFTPVINVQEDYVRIRGLQIANNNADTNQDNAGVRYSGGGEFHLSHCIIAGVNATPDDGLFLGDLTATVKVWNNVFQDWGVQTASNAIRIIANSGALAGAIYHNTISDSGTADANLRINGAGGSLTSFYLKNNVIQDSVNTNYAFSVTGAGIARNEFNLSEDDTAASADPDDVETWATGTADSDVLNHLVDSTATFITAGVRVNNLVQNTATSTFGVVTAINSETDLTLDSDVFPNGNEAYEVYKNYQGTVNFVDEGSDDFHLAATDTVARVNGTDLTSDPDGQLNVTDDIDSDTRPQGLSFDIGADERLRRVLVT